MKDFLQETADTDLLNPIDIWKNIKFNVLSGLRARYNVNA